MAPAAVAATPIPLFAAPTDAAQRPPKDDWPSSTMEGALDFDLLAEYLLEDVGAGGFDFSNPDLAPGGTDPPLDPGVVTPTLAGGSAVYVEESPPYPQQGQPPQQQQQQQQSQIAPLPNGGDLAGELSQVQQLIATNQQQQPSSTTKVAAPLFAAPPAASQQPTAKAPPPARPAAVPALVNGTSASATYRPPPPQPPRPAPAPAAPVAPRPRPTIPAKPAAPQPSLAKRPRVSGPGAYAFAPKTTAAANAAAARAAPLPPAVPLGAMPGSPRQKSQAQVDRRRERNRILARRTRLRKKFFFESLQKDVADLQRENAALKSIVRSRIRAEDARVILERCDANERLPSAVHAEVSGLGGPGGLPGAGGTTDPSVRKLDKEDFSLIQSIQNSQQCFVITDPSLHDNPIVYASDDFLTLTGYTQEEVLGRNCRFLQGTATCRAKVDKIRDAVKRGEDVSVTFVNYTSEGRPFWNSLFVAALRDADNNIVNFIGVIVKVAAPEPGDSEYGKVLK